MNRQQHKPIIWVDSSYKDLTKMPPEVQDDVGFALWRAQEGEKHFSAKPLKGFSGVFEIVSDFKTDTYRAVYAIKIGNHIYVLHAFQKKSKRGISTSKQDLDIIRKRLQKAREMEAQNV